MWENLRSGSVAYDVYVVEMSVDEHTLALFVLFENCAIIIDAMRCEARQSKSTLSILRL